MTGFDEFFSQIQVQAVVTALIIQCILSIIAWLFQRRPRLVYTQTHDKLFLVPQRVPDPQEGSGSNANDQAEATDEPGPQDRDVTVQPAQVPAVRALSVFVADYDIRNEGRLAAKGVEITFNYAPMHYDRFPHINVDEKIMRDGRFALKIETLNPGEQISVSLLNTGDQLPELTLVRCEGYGARKVTSMPARVFPLWFSVIALISAFFGVFSFLYFVSLFTISFL